MRYLVIRQKNTPPNVVIWTQSQHRIEIQPNITRECSHSDYWKKHTINTDDISSVGMVYCDLSTGKRDVVPAEWEKIPSKEDALLVQKAADSFCKEHPELADEIQYDWREYKAWEKRFKELVNNRKRLGRV